MLPKNFGVIIRTAAADAKDADIEQDILSLVERWNKTLAAIRKNQAPALLMSEMSRANTIIRDSLNDTFSQITVDDEAMYNEIRNYVKVIEPKMEKPRQALQGAGSHFRQLRRIETDKVLIRGNTSRCAAAPISS